MQHPHFPSSSEFGRGVPVLCCEGLIVVAISRGCEVRLVYDLVRQFEFGILHEAESHRCLSQNIYLWIRF